MDASGVEFTLLSDVNSAVIEQYGVLNTIVQPTDVPFYGIPFPGFFLVNEEGVIVDKLFNRHLAHREGVESILDSFAGRIVAAPNEPFGSTTEDDGIGVSVFLRGGGGVLRVGPRRRLVVRIDMPDGIHIYGEPVPEGMVATTITIDGPEGFVHDMRDGPPTHAFELPGIDQPLQVIVHFRPTGAAIGADGGGVREIAFCGYRDLGNFVHAGQILEYVVDLHLWSHGAEDRAHIRHAVNTGGKKVTIVIQRQGRLHHGVATVLIREETVAALVTPFNRPA